MTFTTIGKCIAFAGLLTMATGVDGVNAAPLLNGGFENGLTSWGTTGLVSVQGATQGYLPQGSSQALLTTSDGSSDTTVLASFLGLTPEQLDVAPDWFAYEGSAVSQTFSAAAGDVLRFSWALLTREAVGGDALPDYAFVMIDGVITILGHTTTLTMQPLAPPVFTFGSSAATGSYTFATGGMHTVAFGVVDLGDFVGDSGLLLDQVRVDAQQVPEPTSLWLVGLAAIGLARRRLR